MTYSIPTTKRVKTSELTYLCSIRIRLTPEMRSTLKEAQNIARLAQPHPGLPGSSVKAETYQQSAQFSDVVLTDLIATRESIALPVILQLEQLFNITLVNKKDLMAAFKGYVEFVYEKNQ